MNSYFGKIVQCLFHLDFQTIRWGSPTLQMAIYFAPSIYLNVKHIQKHFRRITTSHHISWHPLAQSLTNKWQINLICTDYVYNDPNSKFGLVWASGSTWSSPSPSPSLNMGIWTLLQVFPTNSMGEFYAESMQALFGQEYQLLLWLKSIAVTKLDKLL